MKTGIRLICLLNILWALSVFSPAGAQGNPQHTTFQDCPDCPDIVVIPPKNLLMGSTKEDIERDLATIPTEQSMLGTIKGVTQRDRPPEFMAYEHPQHPVSISKAFGLGRYPVTRGEYAAFVRETGYHTGRCFIFGRSGRSLPERSFVIYGRAIHLDAQVR